MSEATPETDERSRLLAELDEEQTRTLDQRHCVRNGDFVYWIEPEGRLRKERGSRLYYVQTGRGVYRVSKLTGELVEV